MVAGQHGAVEKGDGTCNRLQVAQVALHAASVLFLQIGSPRLLLILHTLLHTCWPWPEHHGHRV